MALELVCQESRCHSVTVQLHPQENQSGGWSLPFLEAIGILKSDTVCVAVVRACATACEWLHKKEFVQVVATKIHPLVLYQPLCSICQCGKKFGCRSQAKGQARIHIVASSPLHPQEGPIMGMHRNYPIGILNV